MLMRARVKNRLELFELLNKNHACVTQTDNAEKWGARRAPRQPRAALRAVHVRWMSPGEFGGFLMCNPLKNMHILPSHGLSFLLHNSSAAEQISPLLFLQSPFAIYVRKMYKVCNLQQHIYAYVCGHVGRRRNKSKKKNRLNSDNNGAARGLTVKDAI